MENIAIENVVCLHGHSLEYFLLRTCAVKVCYSTKGLDILPPIPVYTSLDFRWSSVFSPEVYYHYFEGTSHITKNNVAISTSQFFFALAEYLLSSLHSVPYVMPCAVRVFILTFQFLQNMLKFNSHVGERATKVW